MPTARQQYALTHPLSSAHDDLTPYRQTRRHRTGLLICTILAVDR